MNIYSLLDSVGFFRLVRTAFKRHRSIAMMLHGTYAKTYSHLPQSLHFGMPVAELEKVLQWVRREKIQLLCMSEYLQGKPGLLVTFDDGYANNFEYGLPLLEKYDCPATFFVATKHLGVGEECRWLDNFTGIMAEHQLQVDSEVGYELFYGMTAEHVRKLADHPLISVEAHTHLHKRLSMRSNAQIRSDISQCNEILKDLTGKQPEVFSYPFGDYDSRCMTIVKESGYRAAFAVKPHLRKDARFEIPRIGIYRADPSYLSAKLSFLFAHL